MKVCYGYRNLAGKFHNPVAAIGIFDGVHVGHRRVLKKVLAHKRAGSKEKIVITFDPHPQTVLNVGNGMPRIMTLEHRLSIMEKMGFDAVVVVRFTDAVASMTPDGFVKKILKVIGVKDIFVGRNFYFGRKKSGNIKILKKYCKAEGITVRVVSPVRKLGKVVSSTLIRRMIGKGNLKAAEKLLMRPVSVCGKVVKGDARGQRFGVPTANIDPHHEVSPPPGVYAIKVEIDKKLFSGILNIGFRPTFYSDRSQKREEPLIEVHVLDFEGDLYGKSIEMYFINKLRTERKFRNETELVKQIKKDIKSARKMLEKKQVLRRIVFKKDK